MDHPILNLKELLKHYKKLLSSNSTRISKSLESITKALHCEPVDDPPICQISQNIIYPRHEIFHSVEKNLIMQLANIVSTLEHKTDYVPFLDPFEGVTIMAEAFGCNVEIPLNGDPWVRHPIIHDPMDVYQVQKPSKNNKTYQRVLETLRFFEKNTEYLIPTGPTDPQSPLNIASLLWDHNNFLMSFITNPKEVHYLLDKVTDAFIDFYRMQYEILKNPAYPVHSFQLVNMQDGISVSDDEIILLSPDLYQEFGLPYMNRISEAFGGIYYHCCGDFGYFLNEILQIKNLRAINGHLSPKEFKPEYIEKVLAHGIGLFLGISDKEIGWDDPELLRPESTELIYDGYYLPKIISKSKGRGIVLTGYGSYAGYINAPGSEKATGSFVDNSGHTIEMNPIMNLSIDKKNQNYERIRKMISIILSK